MANINELIKIEGILLRIDEMCKFDLTLNDSIKLMVFLDEIGKITDKYFFLQEEYCKTHNEEELKEYHGKLMSEDIDVNLDKYEEFIDMVVKCLKDEYTLVHIEKERFWKLKD